MSYETEFKEFVDNGDQLGSIQEKDWTFYGQCSMSYTYLHAMPDPNRQDYFAQPYGEDPLQRLDIHHMKVSSKTKFPVIFFIHGGGWTTEDKSNTRFYAPVWLKRGYMVVSINYRLAPNVNHPVQVDDCARALKWVIDNIGKYGGDENRIAIMGHSAGAHLAALMVTGKKWQEKYNIDISKVKCWIPVSGIHDFNLYENSLPPILNSSIAAMLADGDKNDCSPVTHVTGHEPPCLILHGADDWLAPRTNSIKLHDKLLQKGAKHAKLKLVKGYWHCNMMLGYDQEGHVPAEIINEYLDEILPVDKSIVAEISGK